MGVPVERPVAGAPAEGNGGTGATEVVEPTLVGAEGLSRDSILAYTNLDLHKLFWLCKFAYAIFVVELHNLPDLHNLLQNKVCCCFVATGMLPHSFRMSFTHKTS